MEITIKSQRSKIPLLRSLGRGGPLVCPLGYGAFKIGRNEKIKYPAGYDLPDDAEAARLLHGLLDLGVNYIDTAPAYGLSERRIGDALGGRRDEFVLSTKVGETFEGGRSTYDYSAASIEASIHRSMERLRADTLDLVFIHSNGDDLAVLRETDAVPVLRRLREAGLVRRIGLSGKTVEGVRAALEWADAVMVEYNVDDRSHEAVIAEAAERGVGVVVKKALASGTLDPGDALRFVLRNAAVSAAVIGTLRLEHMRANLGAVREV